jgi:hypothetical protein
VQVRGPGGAILRLTLAAGSTLADFKSQLLADPKFGAVLADSTWELSSSFPRRVFDLVAELDEPIEALGLCPTASLTVRVIDADAPAPFEDRRRGKGRGRGGPGKGRGGEGGGPPRRAADPIFANLGRGGGLGNPDPRREQAELLGGGGGGGVRSRIPASGGHRLGGMSRDELDAAAAAAATSGSGDDDGGTDDPDASESMDTDA